MEKILDENIKNRLSKLNDADYMMKYFNKNKSIFELQGCEIISMDIEKFKNITGHKRVLIVNRYNLEIRRSQNNDKVSIIANCHTNGSREFCFNAVQYLYSTGFNHGNYQVTKPYLYDSNIYTFFYKNSKGKELFHYIQQQDNSILINPIRHAAAWLVKLHSTPLPKNRFIKQATYDQIDPSLNFFMPWIEKTIPEYSSKINNIYQTLIKKDKNNLKKLKNRTLVYGDYHPENIIIKSPLSKYITMIDFTDLSIGDPTKDIGCFLQQFKFMSRLFLEKDKIHELQKIFLYTYLNKKKHGTDKQFFSRINLYQAITAFRSMIYIFLEGIYKHHLHISKPLVFELLENCENYLKMSDEKKEQIN